MCLMSCFLMPDTVFNNLSALCAASCPTSHRMRHAACGMRHAACPSSCLCATSCPRNYRTVPDPYRTVPDPKGSTPLSSSPKRLTPQAN